MWEGPQDRDRRASTLTMPGRRPKAPPTFQIWNLESGIWNSILSGRMTWEHKGITFHLEQESLGAFVRISARVPPEGLFVRIRPFSALGRSEEEALAMVKDQIRMEFKRVPELPVE